MDTFRRCSAGALVLLATAAAAGPAAAATHDSFSVSGQVSGKLTLDSAETCASGNTRKEGKEVVVRLYLTDHGVAPTKATWFVLLDANKTGTVHFPASYPNEVSFGADSGVKTAAEWSTSSSATGTATLASNLKSGSVNLKLAPAPGSEKGSAKSDEKIVGSWSCG